MSFETTIESLVVSINRLAAALESAAQATPSGSPESSLPEPEPALSDAPKKKRGRPRKAEATPEPEPTDPAPEFFDEDEAPQEPEPAPISREAIRKVLRAAGSEPDGRAKVIDALARFGVKHLDALDEEQFVPFLGLISAFAPGAVNLLEEHGV